MNKMKKFAILYSVCNPVVNLRPHQGSLDTRKQAIKIQTYRQI